MSKLPRETCQHCNQSVPVRRGGAAREHTLNGRKCPGAGKPTLETLAARKP